MIVRLRRSDRTSPARVNSRQVGRHRVLGDVELAGDLPGGETVGLMAHQQPERIQPSGLREGCKSEDRAFLIHISSITEFIR